MIPLPKDLIRAVTVGTFRFDANPIQAGLGRDPWKVIVSSQLLQRTRRNAPILEELLRRWPTPQALAVSDDSLETLLEPLGLHRMRTRQLQRMSLKYAEGAFSDIRDLPGCGAYVCDAVGLFCFGCIRLESTDEVLMDYAWSYEGPRMQYTSGLWQVHHIHDEWVGYINPVHALKDYERKLCAPSCK